MNTGYTLTHRMTQADFDAGLAIAMSGGLIEIVGSDGVPTGPMYLTGVSGATPVNIGSCIVNYREAVAGPGIEHFRVVYDVDGVTADKTDPTNIGQCLKILGMTDVFTNPGDQMQIIEQGEVTTPSGLSAGAMYLGASGTIVQAVPTSGVFVKLGYVASSTRMMIKVEHPIVLS